MDSAKITIFLLSAKYLITFFLLLIKNSRVGASIIKIAAFKAARIRFA